MADETKQQSTTAPRDPSTAEFQRVEDFAEQYANNVRFERSSWDLKVIFGLLDQSVRPNVVRQFSSVTVSWPQAKLMAYYAFVNIMLHEFQETPIFLRKDLKPVSVDTFIPPNHPNPKALEARKQIQELHRILFGADDGKA